MLKIKAKYFFVFFIIFSEIIRWKFGIYYGITIWTIIWLYFKFISADVRTFRVVEFFIVSYIAFLVFSLIKPIHHWPFNQITLLSFLTVLYILQKENLKELFLKFGNFLKNVPLAIVFSIISSAALIIWFKFNSEYLNKIKIIQVEIPYLWLAGIGFAISNGIFEELIFRSFLFSRLKNITSDNSAVILQAIFFGAIHFGEGSIPNGYTGVVMTFVYGLFMGYLRKKSDGLLAPIFSHAIADFCIYYGIIYIKGLING